MTRSVPQSEETRGRDRSIILRASPRTIVWPLAVAFGALWLTGAVGDIYRIDFLEGFNFDWEGGVPSYYQGLTLLTCAVLFALVALARRGVGDPYTRHWAILAIVLLLASVDEQATIHEELVLPIRETLNTGGLLYLPWVLPVGLLVVVLGLSYIRFFVSLPPRLRRLLLLAAGLYVGGALGGEMVGGYLLDRAGGEVTLAYSVERQAEEALESIGVLVTIYALSWHLAQISGLVGIRFSAPAD
jgi:hypothetical protein